MNEVQIKEIVRGIVREEFIQSLSEARGIPKLFLKIEAVKKEIDRLTAERKSKFGGEYARKLNAETDPKKREKLKEPILAISKKISSYQKNLADLYEKEEQYIQNLDKDTELELTEMGQNDTHFKNILRVYDHGGSFTKKKVAAAVCKNPNANRTKIIDYLKDMDYEEILDVEDELNIGESISEGKKAFKINPGIGKAKYSISSYDGHKKHNDGSDFWDIQIYKNKVDLEKGIKDYKSKGFVEESVNELKLIPKGNGIPGNYFKVKAKYNTFAEYEPHAKIGDTILKYSKKSPSMRAWLETGNLDDRAKQYLSKVHSIGTDGVNLTLFGKQTPASVHPSDKKELAVVVLQN